MPAGVPRRGFDLNIFFIKDSFLYVGGGKDSNESRYSERDFWKADLRTGKWTALKELPFIYQGKATMMIANGRVWGAVPVYGRTSASTIAGMYLTIYKYDDVNDDWQRISYLPLRDDSWPGCFMINGKIYCLPGTYGKYTILGGEESSATNESQCHIYDTLTGQWSTAADYPGDATRLGFAIAINGFGYAGGGGGRLTNSRAVYEYDPSLNRWNRIADLPCEARWLSAWAEKGVLFVGYGTNVCNEGTMVWRKE